MRERNLVASSKQEGSNVKTLHNICMHMHKVPLQDRDDNQRSMYN